MTTDEEQTFLLEKVSFTQLDPTCSLTNSSANGEQAHLLKQHLVRLPSNRFVHTARVCDGWLMANAKLATSSLKGHFVTS